MDFITNRRFRSTLLCHSSVKLNRTINNEDIKKFNITFNVIAEKPIADVDIDNSLESIKFFYNGNKESSLSTSSPVMKAILYSFAENINNPLNFDKIAVLANKKLKTNMLTEVKNEFLNNAMKLVLQGYIQLTLQKTRDEVKLDRPKASTMVLYQVSNTSNMWVTNLRHEVIGINLFEKVALRYMNGTNDKAKIIESVMQHISNGELTLSREGVKLEDINEIKKEISSFYDAILQKALSSSLLV